MASVNTDIAQALDITCRRGDSFGLTINFKQSDGTTAQSLTGYTFEMEVRSTEDDEGTPVISIADAAITIADESGGTISIAIADDVMENVPGDTYVYDIQAVTAGGITTTWVAGTFSVNEDVTI
tara:strand:+ start:1302 stop:1673 length:372 start_codon:yes stop_codon:yes gene_type:complete